MSGQLSLETHCLALGDVYNFGPTFRAENSETKRHLAEFTMLEVELAFAGMSQAMDSAEGLLKRLTKIVLTDCEEEIDFFTMQYDKTLKDRLLRLGGEGEQAFKRIAYTDAVKLLQAEIAKDER